MDRYNKPGNWDLYWLSLTFLELCTGLWANWYNTSQMRTRHSYQEYNRGTSIHANRSSSGRISRKPFIRVLSRQGTKAISYSTLSSLTNKLTEHGLMKSFLKSVSCICMFNVYLASTISKSLLGILAKGCILKWGQAQPWSLYIFIQENR